MSKRETRDFMSVDSFSQLPFIRPSPKPSNSAIRLFGFDFPPDLPPKEEDFAATETITTNSSTTTAAVAGSSETGRKFECHYCCRNFPTSQALGGHQNAHKRERQHAKRAQLQSVMAAAHAHHHRPIAEGHVYGILNYHGFGSSPTPHHNHTVRFGLEPPTGPPPHYPSWSSSGGSGARFYGGLGSVSQPINGNPLPELWRVPKGAMGMVVHRDNRSTVLPLLGEDLEAKQITVMGGGGAAAVAAGSSSSSSSSSSQERRWSELGHSVSLDLHL